MKREIYYKDNNREQQLELIEFIDGEQDCQDGVPPRRNASSSYYAGYSFRYHLIEAMSHYNDKI